MNREMERRRLRAGTFMVNNGRVLLTINLLREKYNALRSVEKGLKCEGIGKQEFVDSVNFLAEEAGIHITKHVPTCFHCGAVDDVISRFGIEICRDCTGKLLEECADDGK